MIQEVKVAIAKNDLHMAWAVLENLAVSLDQMGSMFADVPIAANGAERSRAMLEALSAYLTPELVKAINDARGRLARYIPDDEAEAMAEQINYWDYVTGCKLPGKTI
jgi:hypothetical protein